MFGKTGRVKEPPELHLNITSLMDVLTIVLIFLVFNFDSEENDITPPDGFKLPVSSSERKAKLAVKVTLGPTEISVEDTKVLDLHEGKIRPRDLDKNKHIPKLLNALKKEKQRIQAGAAVAPDDGAEDDSEIVYLEAANEMPYDLVDRILKTSAAAGFAKFRIAVLRNI